MFPHFSPPFQHSPGQQLGNLLFFNKVREKIVQ